MDSTELGGVLGLKSGRLAIVSTYALQAASAEWSCCTAQ